MRWLLPTAIILIVVGIVGLAVVNFYTFSSEEPGITRPPVRGPFTTPGATRFSSSGEQIFFTGTSARGVITTTGGPSWFQMHGGGCAACHGSTGKGGEVFMMGVRFTTPNITYDVLTSEEHAREEGHRPYTNALIRRAITRGLNSEGERLSENMPRWQMSDDDLDDVIEYLKTLDP